MAGASNKFVIMETIANVGAAFIECRRIVDWTTKPGKAMGAVQMIASPEASESMRLKLGLKLQDADGERVGRGPGL